MPLVSAALQCFLKLADRERQAVPAVNQKLQQLRP